MSRAVFPKVGPVAVSRVVEQCYETARMAKPGVSSEIRPMSPRLMQTVAERFKALSDPNRLQLLQLFAARDQSVNELAEAAGLTVANTSKHLAILCKARLIKRRKDGTRVIYALDGLLPRQLCELVCSDVRERAEHQLD